MICPECKSKRITKNGLRKEAGLLRQRWRCRDCKRTFIENSLRKRRFDEITPEIMALCIQLKKLNLTYKQIIDTVYQAFEIEISHTTMFGFVKLSVGEI